MGSSKPKYASNSLAPFETLAQEPAVGTCGDDRFKHCFELGLLGCAVLSPTNGWLEVNNRLCEILGRSREELLGNGWSEMTHPDDVAPVLAQLNRMRLGESDGYEMDHKWRRKDGAVVHTKVALNCVRGADHNIEYLVAQIQETSGHRPPRPTASDSDEVRPTQEDLEMLVMERTAEVDAVNGALRDEIIERERAEYAQQELLRQLVTAQEEERRRISRELHDEIGQHLTALMLGLKSLEAGHPTAVVTLRQLQRLTETVGREIHELALELRPTALDDHGLLRTLSNYVDDWSVRTQVEVDFHATGWVEERLPPAVETTLYRIVQEALNNVLKHAGATRVSVILDRRADQAVAIVEDNGKGFNIDVTHRVPGARHLGLLGMKERAALIGGELSIESSRGKGTTVFVRIPLPATSDGGYHG